MKMTEKGDSVNKEEIKAIFKEVLDEKMTEFWVDREVHYQHHEFLSSLIKWVENTKHTIFGTIVKTFVIGIIGLILLGFIFWGKGHFK